VPDGTLFGDPSSASAAYCDAGVPPRTFVLLAAAEDYYERMTMGCRR
jgi:hypothetical protein